MTPVRLELATLRSRVKDSTTEPLRSLIVSGLDLHCSALSHKIDTMFYSVKISKERFLGHARIQKVLSQGF